MDKYTAKQVTNVMAHLRADGQASAEGMPVVMKMLQAYRRLLQREEKRKPIDYTATFDRLMKERFNEDMKERFNEDFKTEWNIFAGSFGGYQTERINGKRLTKEMPCTGEGLATPSLRPVVTTESRDESHDG